MHCHFLPDRLDQQFGTPEGDGCHPVRKDGENGRRGVGVVSPAFAGGAPEFEEVSQRGTGDKGQNGDTIIGWRDDEQEDKQGGKEGIGFIKGGGDEGEHEGEESSEQ